MQNIWSKSKMLHVTPVPDNPKPQVSASDGRQIFARISSIVSLASPLFERSETYPDSRRESRMQAVLSPLGDLAMHGFPPSEARDNKRRRKAAKINVSAVDAVTAYLLFVAGSIHTKKPDSRQVFSGKRKIWVEKCFALSGLASPFRKCLREYLAACGSCQV